MSIYTGSNFGGFSTSRFGGYSGSGSGASAVNAANPSGGGGMGFGAAIIAGTITSMFGSILEGYVRKAEAKVTEAQYNLNATIAEGQADMINFAKGISNQRWFKKKGATLAKSMARQGASGLRFSGSSMAVVVETQRQMNIDHIIDQFNYDQDIRYTKNEAKQLRYKGSQAMDAGRLSVSKGYTNAFASALTGASKYGLYKGAGKLTQEGTIRSSVFDSVR